MKTIKKNVYYCDFCNKRSLSAPSTSKHEKHCTANPNRSCRMCEGNNIGELVEGFKKRFTLIPYIEDYGGGYKEDDFKVEWIGDPVTLNEIQETVDYCPACVLSVLRQAGFSFHYFGFEYDYKKEVGEYWAEKNKHAQQEHGWENY